MKTYRTPAQFQTIVQNATNGNWSDAAQNCVDFGFYANDLIRANEAAKEGDFYLDELGDDAMIYPFEEDTDIAILAEMAANIRNRK